MVSNSEKRAFVTGTTGFIGSRVAEILCRDGWNVCALVRSTSKAKASFERWHPDAPRNVDFVEGDLFAGSPGERMRLFTRCMKDSSAVIHLAEAKIKAKNSDAKNIKSLGLLLEAARGTPSLQRFVFVSAFMAGGLPMPLPNILTEDMTGVEFPDPYYRWKRMAERLVVKAAIGSHFSYSIVRPALVYGPNAEWLTGMLKLIKGAGRYLVPLPEAGKVLLGTVHVEDAANTIAMSGWSDQAHNQVIHAVDSGRTTYADWIYEIAKNTGWRVNVRRIPKGIFLSLARTADALTSVAGVHYGAYLWALVLSEGCAYSNDRMKKIIGPLSYPTIREGIPGMMKWFDAVHP